MHFLWLSTLIVSAAILAFGAAQPVEPREVGMRSTSEAMRSTLDIRTAKDLNITFYDQPCKIVNANQGGYSEWILNPIPVNARVIAPGPEIKYYSFLLGRQITAGESVSFFFGEGTGGAECDKYQWEAGPGTPAPAGQFLTYCIDSTNQPISCLVYTSQGN